MEKLQVVLISEY